LADLTRTEAATMASTAQKFHATKDELSAMLQQLMGELEQLQSSWQGSGANAFMETKERWQTDTAKLNQALAETADAVAKAGTYYTNTDQDSAGRLGGIGGSDVKLPL
jgi:WXG100 family type VII secretion target